MVELGVYSPDCLSGTAPMPSNAYRKWQTERLAALDQIEQAHRGVGGAGPGRRYTTQQVNQAYVVLLSSQFQAFCRDLHSECIDHVATKTKPAGVRSILRKRLVMDRKLDKGNAEPGSIGSDFGWFDITLWDRVKEHDKRWGKQRQAALTLLNVWRNAIAHQAFDKPELKGRKEVRFAEVRVWRKACEGLAVSVDEALRVRLKKILNKTPW